MAGTGLRVLLFKRTVGQSVLFECSLIILTIEQVVSFQALRSRYLLGWGGDFVFYQIPQEAKGGFEKHSSQNSQISIASEARSDYTHIIAEFCSRC